jgi:hypothetical protein
VSNVIDSQLLGLAAGIFSVLKALVMRRHVEIDVIGIRIVPTAQIRIRLAQLGAMLSPILLNHVRRHRLLGEGSLGRFVSANNRTSSILFWFVAVLRIPFVLDGPLIGEICGTGLIPLVLFIF